jgi:hypothetical protein
MLTYLGNCALVVDNSTKLEVIKETYLGEVKVKVGRKTG